MVKEIIYGDDMQIVEVELSTNESMRAEAGAMLYMTQGIDMDTSTKGGILKGLKRAFTGESFFITSFTNRLSHGEKVAFGAPYPGKIIPLDLKKSDYLCQRDSFLCAEDSIEIEIAFTKRIGAGLFGGEGFILQRLTGKGKAFVHAGGTIIKKELKQGETLRVDTGCLVAFQPTVDYDIQFIGGFKNALFGGEGLFVATLTGPGEVFLQSLPFSRLADRILQAIPKQTGERTGVSGFGGDLLKGVISGSRKY